MEQKKFLLADDDIDDREMFCEALGTIDKHIICHAVADGHEALASLHQDRVLPALIFLDVNMPVMNGWQCLQKLNEDNRYSSVPVIIMSTSSHQREIDIAKGLHALCYLTKPHDFKDLIYVLRTIVANTGPTLAKALHELEVKGSPYVRTLATDSPN